MNFCVFGAGAWGTAMSVYLSKQGHVVTLVPRRMEHALKLSSDRENMDYLPGIQLGLDLQIGCSLRPAVMECDYLLLACPSHSLKVICKSIVAHKADFGRLKGAIALCKGLEPYSTKFAHEVIQDELGMDISSGYLTGPTNAREIAEGKPAAMVLAINLKEDLLIALQDSVSSQTLRVYRSNDRVGVGVGSCLKNIYAIATGLSDGLGLGDNARAALLTRSMNEMIGLGRNLGGRSETMIGLSGFGDLVCTCMSEWSRNRNFGFVLAKGEDPEKAANSSKAVVEGYWATACFYNKCKDLAFEMPILREVYSILYEGKKPSLAIEELMSRGLKSES